MMDRDNTLDDGTDDLGGLDAYTDGSGWDEKARRERVLQDRARVRTWAASIPEVARTVVGPFTTRHWHLVSMTARCEDALELLADHPALGFALASCWVFTKVPSSRAMRWIRRMVPRRRRDILEGLGFPKLESAVRVLAKLAPGDCCVNHLLLLRKLLADPCAAKQLAHFPVIDTELLTVMGRPRLREAVHPRFLSQLGAGGALPVERYYIPGMLTEYLWMCGQLGVPEKYRKFHSVEALVAAHADVADRLAKCQYSLIRSYAFPPPPVPGTSNIVPVTSPDELVTESLDQRNCVASFARDVAAGGIYIYRLFAPERATVSLRLDGQAWQLDEVAAASNEPVSSETYAELADWLGIDLPF